MADIFRDAFVWAQSLSLFPKAIISLVWVLICVLGLVVLWTPSEKVPQKEVSISRQPQQPPTIPASPDWSVPTQQAAREFTNRSARQLLSLYEGRTPLPSRQAHGALQGPVD